MLRIFETSQSQWLTFLSLYPLVLQRVKKLTTMTMTMTFQKFLTKPLLHPTKHLNKSLRYSIEPNTNTGTLDLGGPQWAHLTSYCTFPCINLLLALYIQLLLRIYNYPWCAQQIFCCQYMEYEIYGRYLHLINSHKVQILQYIVSHLKTKGKVSNLDTLSQNFHP